MLAAGLNANRSSAEIRHDGKRRFGDGLRRAAAGRGIGQGLRRPRYRADDRGRSRRGIGDVRLLSPVEAFCDLTPTSHPLTTLLPADATVASGLFAAGVTGLCWLANVLAFSPDTFRIGAPPVAGAAARCR